MKPLKILFADDDLKYSMLLKRFLEKEGYEVTYAGNGTIALEQFPLVKPDLVLLDINMPGCNGFEVAERIRETDKHVLIFFLSDRSDKADRLQGFQLRTNLDSEETRQKLLRKVEPDDLVKFGLIPELIGRLPVVTVLDPLDEESLIRVLTEPKNSIVRQYKELLAMDSAELSFTDAALRAIAQKTIARKSGARGLRSVVEDILIPIMYEIPSDPTITRVTIDADTVNGGQPHLEYGAVRKRYKNKAIIKQ